MSQGIVGPQGVTTLNRPAVAVLEKVISVSRTDTTAFDAFALPKYAVVAGVYVLGATASDAGTTATISVGTNPGTTNEILAAFDAKTNYGYQVAGTAAGSAIGTQLTADTKYKAKYAETGDASTAGGPWLVKVEYYIPQQGQSY